MAKNLSTTMIPKPTLYIDGGRCYKHTNMGSNSGSGGKSYASTPEGLNPSKARRQSYSPELGPNAIKGSKPSATTGNKSKTIGTKIKGY